MAGTEAPSDGRDLYDHGKVAAFVGACVDLAGANGLNLVELAYASRNLMLAAEMQLVSNNADLLDSLAGEPEE